MKTPSAARERTLALQRRALTFSTGVNIACPRRFTNIPSETVWRQLVRAANSVSNNLTEADEAVSGPDFVHKIKLTLREAKESRICLEKVRLAKLDRFEAVLELEREAGELCAIFATIALKVANRLEREKSGAKQLKR
jgi:four helix bundle protein